MTEPYLIRHKVRGEPAFDIAEKAQCVVCKGAGKHEVLMSERGSWPCTECNSTGSWWIVSTSGHRAYPWWTIELSELQFYRADKESFYFPSIHATAMPLDWPDHFACNNPQPTKLADRVPKLLELIGLKQKVRRI